MIRAETLSAAVEADIISAGRKISQV